MFVERVNVDSVSEVTQGPNSVQKFLKRNSTEKHDYQAQVDMNSSDLSNYPEKKKKRARKRRKSSGCLIGSLGSTDKGALSSVLVVEEISLEDKSSNHLSKAKHGSSVLGAGEISQEKASGGPDSELLPGKRKKKYKRKRKKKLSACPVTSLGSTEEGASPSVLVVPHSSVGEKSLDQSDEVLTSCDAMKLMEEVVAGNGTPVLTGGEISLEIASSKRPDGKSQLGKMKEEYKMGKLEDNKIGNGRIHRRKKRKSSAYCISNLESIEEGVQESSVAYTCQNHLNEAPESSYSGEKMEEMVAGLIISQEKASGGCPKGEPVCGNGRKKSKKKRLEDSNTGNGVVMDVSLVDIQETNLEQDISVRDISSNHVVKGEDCSSGPAAGETSQEKASGGPSFELVSGQKEEESKRKKKRKLTACPMTGLGSIEEGASPSVLVVPDSSGGEIYLQQSDEVPTPCNSVKLMEEAVAGNDTSLLDGGKSSQEIASSECTIGKSDMGRKEESKMGNLEENNAGHGGIRQRKKRKLVACPISSLESIKESLQESSAGYTCLNYMDEAPEPSYKGKMMEEVLGLGFSQEKASCERPVGKPAFGKKRKKSMVGNLEESNERNRVAMEVYRASDDVLGGVSSVDNIVVDKLNMPPLLKDKIPSSSKMGVIIDGISLECPQQSHGGAPHGNLTKKLLVLDVNGLLADIVPSGPGVCKPHKVLSQKAVFKRPFCDDFLQFCFDRFHVGVWSSRTRKNVNSVLDYLMGKSKSNLLFCWDQSHCTKTGYTTVENGEKPLLLKELKKIWEKHKPDLPWASEEYNESNTLLLDDSPYKALRNPPYTAIFPHSYCYKDKGDNSLGPGGDLRVYLEGLASADHVQKYVEQNPFGQRPITDTNLSWGFYRKIIGIPSSEKGENVNDP